MFGVSVSAEQRYSDEPTPGLVSALLGDSTAKENSLSGDSTIVLPTVLYEGHCKEEHLCFQP